jgi:hypothetical protein
MIPRWLVVPRCMSSRVRPSNVSQKAGQSESFQPRIIAIGLTSLAVVFHIAVLSTVMRSQAYKYVFPKAWEPVSVYVCSAAWSPRGVLRVCCAVLCSPPVS